MKNLIIGFGTMMMSVLTIMIITALDINTINQLDLDNAARLAVYQTLEQRYDSVNIPMRRVKNEDGSYKKFTDYPSGDWKTQTQTVNGEEVITGYSLLDTDGTYKYADTEKKICV